MSTQTNVRLTPEQLATYLHAGWFLTQPAQDLTIAEAAEHLARHDPRGPLLSEPRFALTGERIRELLYAVFTLVGEEPGDGRGAYESLDHSAKYLTGLVNDPDPRDAEALQEILEEVGGFELHEAQEIVQGITGFPLVEGDR